MIRLNLNSGVNLIAKPVLMFGPWKPVNPFSWDLAWQKLRAPPPSLVGTPGSQHVPESQPTKALTTPLQAVAPQRPDTWWGDCPGTFILECSSVEAVRMLRKTGHGPCPRVIRNAKHLHWSSWEKKAASSLALGYMAVKGNLLPETTVHSPSAVPCLLLGIPHDILSRSAPQQRTYGLCVSQAFVSCATSKVLCPLFIYQYWLLFCKTKSLFSEDSGFLHTTPANHSQIPSPFPFSLTLIPAEQLSSQHHSVPSFAKSNCFLFKTPNVYDCLVTHGIVNELHVMLF